MYKLMIVDDEAVIRKGLVNFIQWDAIGCQLVSEASNGLEAIEKIKEASPDIIITDVKMPGLNGIGLAKHIYENRLPIKVIILSGYADFSYAQSALKYGVVDFVLKPAEPEQLAEAVLKARQAMDLQKQNELKLNGLEGRVSQSLPELQEKLLRDIIDGLVRNQALLAKKASELGITAMQDYYVLAYELEDTGGSRHQPGAEYENVSILNINNFLSGAFNGHTHFLVSMDKSHLCSIVAFDPTCVNNCMHLLLNICGEILRSVNSFMKFSISIGISSSHKSLTELPEAYKEALSALSSKFYIDGESCISIYTSYTNNMAHADRMLVNSYLERIIRCLLDDRMEASAALIHELFEKLRSDKQPIEYIKNMGIHLCSSFETLLSGYDTSLSECMPNGSGIYVEILQSRSIGCLRDILTGVVNSTAAFLTNRSKQNSMIINKVLDYIRDNYKSPITLQQLADHVHVNSSYLSRLFKKKTGETITDAIIKFRIEKAKELLLNTNLKTYEVAAEVGIDDPPYFSVIFKKYTGISPKDYARSTT